MRLGVSPFIVAALAIAALTIHLTVPFAEVTLKDPDGTVTEETLSRAELADKYANADEKGIPYEVVPGTGLTFMLVSLGIVALGAVVFAVASMFETPKAGYTAVIAGVITVVAGVLAFRANALWTGRGLADSIETWPLQSDGPPKPFQDMLADHSAIDFVTAFQTISAPIIVAVLALMFVFLVRAWSMQVREERSLRHMARRHGRMALFGMLSLGVLLTIPLAVWEMPDTLTPPEGRAQDSDPFLFSAYDIIHASQISHAEALDIGEAGITMWPGLSALLVITAGVLAASVVLAFGGLAGKHLESLDVQVLGRLIENLSLINVLAHPFTILVALLGAFVLQHPTDFEEITTTGLPLIAAVPAGLAAIYAGFVARDVIRDDSDLVADDFPEPVVYD